jgi:hypothetical protein
MWLAFELLLRSVGLIFLEITLGVIVAFLLWIHIMKENLQKFFARLDEVFTPPWKKGN